MLPTTNALPSIKSKTSLCCCCGTNRQVIKPSSNDFLIGKDKICLNNPGNKLVKRLVADVAEEYDNTEVKVDYLDSPNKRTKQFIRREVANTIQDAGGKFLQRCMACSGAGSATWWCEVTERRALEAIGGVFRNHKRNAKKQMKRGAQGLIALRNSCVGPLETVAAPPVDSPSHSVCNDSLNATKMPTSP